MKNINDISNPIFNTNFCGIFNFPNFRDEIITITTIIIRLVTTGCKLGSNKFSSTVEAFDLRKKKQLLPKLSIS